MKELKALKALKVDRKLMYLIAAVLTVVNCIVAAMYTGSKHPNLAVFLLLVTGVCTLLFYYINDCISTFIRILKTTFKLGKAIGGFAGVLTAWMLGLGFLFAILIELLAVFIVASVGGILAYVLPIIMFPLLAAIKKYVFHEEDAEPCVKQEETEIKEPLETTNGAAFAEDAAKTDGVAFAEDATEADGAASAMGTARAIGAKGAAAFSGIPKKGIKIAVAAVALVAVAGGIGGIAKTRMNVRAEAPIVEEPKDEPTDISEHETVKSMANIQKGTEERNREALEAYCNALTHDERLISPGVFGETEFTLADINSDNISEMFVYVPGTCNGDTCSYLLYYTDQLNFSAPLDWSFGMIKEKSRFISTRAAMCNCVSVYSFDGEKIETVEQFFHDWPESPEYNKNKAENDLLTAYNEELTKQAEWPDLIPVNSENMRSQFGSIADEVFEAEKPTADEEPEISEEDIVLGRPDVNLDEDIPFIRQIYAYTNEHIDEYEKTTTNKDADAWGNDSGDIYFYKGDVQVKRLIDHEELRIEVYDKNPDLDSSALPAVDTYPEFMAVFIFATDSKGQEYRIYMKDAYVIRYIGPDHEVVDYPDGIDLAHFGMGNQLGLSGGDAIWKILCAAAPGWWVAFEGER